MTYGPPSGNSGGFPPPGGPGGQPPGGHQPGGYQPGGQQPGGYQPGGYQPGHQPGPGYPPQQSGYQSAFGSAGPNQTSAKSRLLAPRSSNSAVRFPGIALAVGGLLIVLFSFFTWASQDFGVGSVSISGLGSVTIDAGDDTADSSEVADAESEAEAETSAPGIVTIVIGLLLAGAAVPLIINRYPAIAAIAGTVLGLVAVIVSLVFIADPGSVVIDGDAGDTSEVDAGWALWLVVLGAFITLIAAGVATYLALAGKGSRPGPGVSGPQQPQGYGPPPQQFGTPGGQAGGYGQAPGPYYGPPGSGNQRPGPYGQ
ncbi:hypothetical protein KXR83_08300 [Williamsia muralis]|uniref:hypothetical protein n=1 Tax=Williamsia marianensis TaxID=85044 RepID=UPI003F18377E